MSNDVLDRLREADPAAGPMPDAPDELLVAVTSTPHRRVRRRPVVVVGVATAAAAALAVTAVMQGGGPSLAEQAYAKSAPIGDSILYVRTTHRDSTRLRLPGHDGDSVVTTETWQQGKRWHTITHDDDGRVTEEVRGADGILHLSNGENASREAGDDAREYIDRRSRGFLEEFRRAYERGRLDESGDAVFAGRDARRYVYTWGGGKAEYFLDADTGQPLGSRGRLILQAGPTLDAKTAGHVKYSETVDALEQLPNTPENRAKLAGR